MNAILASPNGISGGTLELIAIVLVIFVLLFFLVGGRWRR